jgi:hypothetical protein
VIYFLRAEEIDSEQSWQLLTWCAAHGGTEFFVRQMSLQGLPEPNLDQAAAVLSPYRLPPGVRPRTVEYDGRPDSEITELWRLSTESIQVLRSLFPSGLFESPTYDSGGWLEEPTVFRENRVLFGVVSHEGEAFMDLADEEVSDLRLLGFRFHPRGFWI